MNEIEKKLKEKIIDEKLYYVTKGGQKVHCFGLISYEDALEICKQVSVEPEVKVQIAKIIDDKIKDAYMGQQALQNGGLTEEQENFEFVVNDAIIKTLTSLKEEISNLSA